MSVKGSWQRPDKDKSKFNEEYDRIFNKSKETEDTPIRGHSFDYVIIDEWANQEDLGDCDGD